MAETILKLLDLFQQGMMTASRISVIRARINDMKAGGRDPTAEEWASLFDSIFVDSGRLHEAAKGT